MCSLPIRPGGLGEDGSVSITSFLTWFLSRNASFGTGVVATCSGRPAFFAVIFETRGADELLERGVVRGPGVVGDRELGRVGHGAMAILRVSSGSESDSGAWCCSNARLSGSGRYRSSLLGSMLWFAVRGSWGRGGSQKGTLFEPVAAWTQGYGVLSAAGCYSLYWYK